MREERIKKDLALFEQHLQGLEDTEAVDMAKRYYCDAQYYLSKKDFFTAFGCINYAHGILDAVRVYNSEKKGE
ncbi:MAG: DUF357 domain-containing protein [Thermoplasmatota archaeon]